MTTKKEPPKESVPPITGSGLEQARNNKSKKLLRISMLLFVLVLAAGSLFLAHSRQPNNNNKSKEAAPTVIPSVSDDELISDKQLALAAASRGNFDEALSILQPYLDKAKPGVEKAEVFATTAQAAYKSGKLELALDYANKSNTENENVGAWAIIGDISAVNKDWNKAVIAFGKAASLSPTSDPDDARSDRNNYLMLQKTAKDHL